MTGPLLDPAVEEAVAAQMDAAAPEPDPTGISADTLTDAAVADVLAEPREAGLTRPLSESVALVTGGASGIGLAVVQQLRAAGAKVVVADLDHPVARAAVGAAGAMLCAGDVRDPATSVRAVAMAEETFGGLDLVHLNAGVATTAEPYDIAELDLDAYRRAVAINTDAVFYGIRACLPALRRRGGGAVVVTASLSGLVAHPADPVYSMTKHAVVGLVRALGEALPASGITVDAVCPGFVDTPLIADARELFTESGFPLLSADEVAEAVLAAAADRSSGDLWVCQPGRDPIAYAYRGVPGPRFATGDGTRPPQRMTTGAQR